MQLEASTKFIKAGKLRINQDTNYKLHFEATNRPTRKSSATERSAWIIRHWFCKRSQLYKKKNLFVVCP